MVVVLLDVLSERMQRREVVMLLLMKMTNSLGE